MVSVSTLGIVQASGISLEAGAFGMGTALSPEARPIGPDPGVSATLYYDDYRRMMGGGEGDPTAGFLARATGRASLCSILNEQQEGTTGAPVDTVARYQTFVERIRDGISHELESHRDRAIAVSPLGLRDGFEAFLRFQLRLGERHANTRHLKNRRILLVTRGLDNIQRWRDRLDRVFRASTKGVPHQDRTLWTEQGISVQLVSIDTLKRLRPAKRQEVLDAGMMALDLEQHVRAVEDDDPDRGYYFRLLLDAGFLRATQDARGSLTYEARLRPGHFLLGLSPSVSEGAGRLYGSNPYAVLVMENLSSCLTQGLVARPEVRIVEPQGQPPGQGLHQAWSELSPEERQRHIVAVLNHLEREFQGKGKKNPRYCLYANSITEAHALAQDLEARYSGEVSLLTSDQSDTKRRVAQEDFLKAARRFGIHVLTGLEGVDEYATRPVDAVLYTAVSYAGGENYASQAVSAHLSARSRPPILVDLSGMFGLHSDLAYFNGWNYVLEKGRLRPSRSLSDVSHPRPPGQARATTLNTYSWDLFGVPTAHYLADALARLPIPSQNRLGLAFRLNCSAAMLGDLFAARILPDQAWLKNLARVLGLSETQETEILDAWAWDQVERMELLHPLPSNLSPDHRELVRNARWGFWRGLEGNLALLADRKESSLLKFISKGVLLEKSTGPYTIEDFYSEVAWLVSGGRGERTELAESLIVKVILEQSPSPASLADKPARLRLWQKAHELLACHPRCRGRLPIYPPNVGLQRTFIQGGRSVLRRWLRGEEIEYNNVLTVANFYEQVKNLFLDLGAEEPQAEELIVQAVLEEIEVEHPPYPIGSARLILWTRTREALARHPRCRGRLPRFPKEIGLLRTFDQSSENPTLSCWLLGEEIGYAGHVTRDTFHAQIKNLLLDLGVEEPQAEDLVVQAVSEEIAVASPPYPPGSARLALWTQARELLVRHPKCRGRLPYHPSKTNFRKTGEQTSSSPLTRWIRGEIIQYNQGVTIAWFYHEVKDLLLDLGVEEPAAENLIVDAVVEENFVNAIPYPEGSVRFRLWREVREGLVRHPRCRGRLPALPETIGFNDIPLQRDRSPLTHWLLGRRVTYSSQFTCRGLYKQVRNLMLHLGWAEAEAENSVQAAIREEEADPAFLDLANPSR